MQYIFNEEECVLCFFDNKTTVIDATFGHICSSCIEMKITEYCYQYIYLLNTAVFERCNVCGMKKKLLFEVPMCHNHQFPAITQVDDEIIIDVINS